MSATEITAKSEANADYRYFYLKTDISEARKITLLLAIPMLIFVINDFLFFGVSSMFAALAAIRGVIAGIIFLEFYLLGRVKTYRSYDMVIFWGTLGLIILGGVINLTRPENYLIHAVMTIVGIFVLFLLVPSSFRNKFFIVSFMTFGELGIMLLSYTGGAITVLSTLTMCMIVAFILAAYSSRQLHAHRHQIYEVSVKRSELEKKLKSNSDNLAMLVDVRTKELVDAQARLVKSERLAAIGELAGMVAHDLRNPLAGVKNAAYFLRKKNSVVLDESGRLMLSTIDRSVDHADKIIGDLLEYSRDVKLNVSEQNPKALVCIALQSLNIPDSVKVVDNTEETPLVMVDVVKMQRVFSNLVKNAVEAMPSGGVLEIGSRVNGGSVEFVFSDTGVGIPQEIADRLFAPLVTTKAQGMGFGLAICKRFVEAHSGEIAVKSMPDLGTTFTVSIPLASNAGGV